jgi:hypothetical protein
VSGRVYLLGVGALLVTGALLLTDALLPKAAGVTAQNVRRIKPGMSREEVERIFGGPAATEAMPMDLGEGVRCYYWVGERGAAWVHFHPNGAVAIHPFFRPEVEPSTPFDRLRAWLGW